MGSPPDTFNPKLLELLRENPKLTNRWLNTALKYIRIYFPGDEFKPEPQDIVHDLIVKISINERRWDPEKIDITHSCCRIFVVMSGL